MGHLQMKFSHYGKIKKAVSAASGMQVFFLFETSVRNCIIIYNYCVGDRILLILKMQPLLLFTLA